MAVDHLAQTRPLDGLGRASKVVSSGRWVRVTLYFNELDALADLLTFHSFQVKQLGRAEFLAAIDAAHKDTLAQGFTATLVHNVERMAA